MHVKESEGTIKEVILTDKQIMFKHKHTEEEDIKTAIETMNEDGKIYEQMKKGEGKARERKKYSTKENRECSHFLL